MQGPNAQRSPAAVSFRINVSMMPLRSLLMEPRCHQAHSSPRGLFMMARGVTGEPGNGAAAHNISVVVLISKLKALAVAVMIQQPMLLISSTATSIIGTHNTGVVTQEVGGVAGKPKCVPRDSSSLP